MGRRAAPRTRMARLATRWAVILLLGHGLSPAWAADQQQRLETLDRELDALGDTHRELTDRQARQQRLLQDAERGIAEALQRRRQLDTEIQRLQARQAALSDELALARRDTAVSEQALGELLRLLQHQQRQGPWQLLLGDNPAAQRQRLLVLQTYLGTAQRQRLETLMAEVGHLTRLQRELDTNQARLAERRDELRANERRWRDQAAARRTLLEEINREQRSTAARIARLEDERRSLRELLQRLAQQRLQRQQRFSGQRGRLPWPVAGRISAGFGEARGDTGRRWRGLLLTAPAGTPVRAVAPGEVRYADWMRHLGLLVILDHGDGYLSLYAHQQSLFVQVGQQLAAGEVLGEVGDSGGRSGPALYFELRKDGDPTDPRQWLGSAP